MSCMVNLISSLSPHRSEGWRPLSMLLLLRLKNCMEKANDGGQIRLRQECVTVAIPYSQQNNIKEGKSFISHKKLEVMTCLAIHACPSFNALRCVVGVTDPRYSTALPCLKLYGDLMRRTFHLPVRVEHASLSRHLLNSCIPYTWSG